MFYKVLLILSIFFLGACQEELKEMPKDLKILYTTGPTHADRGPKTFISITPLGNSWKYTHGKKFRFISKDIGYKTKDEVKTIFTKLQQYNFFTMKDKYKHPKIMGGDFQLLKVNSNGKEKSVLVFNQINEDFQAIIKSIEGI